MNSPGVSATPASRSCWKWRRAAGATSLDRSGGLPDRPRVADQRRPARRRGAGGGPHRVRRQRAACGVSDSGRTRPANGGRGLAGIRERVEERGELTAGPGPEAVGRSTPPSPCRPHDLGGSGRRDDQLVRSGVRMILETAPDITVTAEASDGEEAIRLVSKSRPDVVLMDVRMPGTDGIDATRRLATMAPECRIAILTTFEHDEYVFEALRAGASGFLPSGSRRMISSLRFVPSPRRCSLSPSVTRRLIEVFARRTTGKASIRRVGTAHRAGAPSPGRAGDRCLERRASRGALHLRGDGADPREAGPLQTGSAGSSPGDRLRLRVRTGSPRSSSAAGLH